MEQRLIERLSSFNPHRPYVWEMRLSLKDFEDIRSDIAGRETDLKSEEDARLSFVYIAEWYKREYSNKNKEGYKEAFGDKMPDLKTVWTTLKISTDFLYTGEVKSLWLYSTFVLGGLAIKLETQKSEEKVLRGLCRVYNNPEADTSYDSIGNEGQSFAFKESAKRGSLKEYFSCVLSNDDDKLPFDTKEIKDTTTDIRLLIDKIRAIYKDVRRSKFRMEWLYYPYDAKVVRQLRLWLNPEESGTKQYNIIDCQNTITEQWGIKDPYSMRYIYIGIKYYKGEILIKDIDKNHPILTYRNTGNPDVGFISDVYHYKTISKVPVQWFDKIELVAWDSEGEEYTVHEETVDDIKQLYRETDNEEIWTSRTKSQTDTVLAFSERYHLSEDSEDKATEEKTLYNQKYGDGDRIYWCPINTSVKIDGIKERFYNHAGHDLITTKLYDNTIKYAEGNRVTAYEYDEETETEMMKNVPLIFSKEDLLCYRCEKDENDNDTYEEAEPELLEYRQHGAKNFTEWTNSSFPEYGFVEIRATARGRRIPNSGGMEIFLMPGKIERDCVNNTITYYDFDELGTAKVVDEKEEIEHAKASKELLNPTTKIYVGSEKEHVEIEVYKPTLIKELCFDGKIIGYDTDGRVTIPYILKNHLQVNDFSENGYQHYECKNIRSIFPKILKEYMYSGEIKQEADGKIFNNEANAPVCIDVIYKKQFSNDEHKEYLCYTYCSDNNPEVVQDIQNFVLTDGCVLFQNMKDPTVDLSCESKDNPISTFKKRILFRNGVPWSVVRCFEVAVKYNLYFWNFEPLRELTRDGMTWICFSEQLYKPLILGHRNDIPIELKEGLLRFVDEFCLSNLIEPLTTELNKLY